MVTHILVLALFKCNLGNSCKDGVKLASLPLSLCLSLSLSLSFSFSHAHTHKHTHTHTHTHKHTHTQNTHTHIHTHTHTRAHTHTQNTHTHIHTHTHTLTHAIRHTCTCAQARTHFFRHWNADHTKRSVTECDHGIIKLPTICILPHNLHSALTATLPL